MKSFSAILYVEPAVRSTDAPVHEPSTAGGQVRASRSPPALVIANSTPLGAYLVRIASVVTLPTSDSHVRPAALPQASVLGMAREEDPMTVPRMGASWALRASIRAWMAAFGVTPMSHGLCQSAVL